MNKKIKKVFEKFNPEVQEAVKFLINEIMVKRNCHSVLVSYNNVHG